MQRNSAAVCSPDCACPYAAAAQFSDNTTFQAGTAGQNATCQEDCLTAYPCPLATAYFIDQKYNHAFQPDAALENGTLFPCLVRPWMKEV